MNLHKLQPSFNNGEITPLLYDRVDFEKFFSSLKSGKNMFVHFQGGASNRAGTMMLYKCKDEKVRNIPFEFSNNETYTIEFGNGYCRFFTSDGIIVVENKNGEQVPYEIESPYSTEDLDNIRVCQSGDVMYIASGKKPQTLVRYGHTNWQFEEYDYKNGPFGLTENTGEKVSIEAETALSEADFLCVFRDKSSQNIAGTFSSTNFNGPWELLKRAEDIDLSSYKIVNGRIFFASNSGYGLFYTEDLVTFKKILEGKYVSEEDVFYGVTSSDTGLYFIITKEGVLYSYNLTDFASTNLPYFQKAGDAFTRGIFYINDTLVASISETGSSFSLYTSSDGITWNKFLEENSETAPDFVYYKNNTYYCFGAYLETSSNYNGLYQITFSSLDGTYEKKKSNTYALNYSVYQSGNYFYCVGTTGNLFCFEDISSLTLVPNISSVSILSLNKESDGLYVRKTYNYNTSSGGELYLVKHPTSDSFTVEEISYSNNNYLIEKIVNVSVSGEDESIRLVADKGIFTANDVGRVFSVEAVFNSSTWTQSQDDPNYQKSLTVSSDALPTDGNFFLKTTGTWTGSVNIMLSENGEDWIIDKKLSGDKIANFDLSYGGLLNYNYVKISLLGIKGSFSITFSCDGFSKNIFVTGTKFISSVILQVEPEEGLFDFVKQASVGKFPIEFGTWYYGGYYPTDVDLYQDRIEWVTNNTLDATKISDYTNFGVSTDVTDEDAISVIVKDKKINKINSIVSGAKLVVFTDDGNFIHDENTFTPSTATFRKQGSTGGASVKPIVVRDNVIYVQPMRTAISNYAYSFETDGYAGQDITLLAQHLFVDEKVKELHYQQEPYSIIWVLLESGKVLACTYLRQQNVIAWTPMDFGGEVQSMCVLSNGANQELFLAVKRKNGTFMEKMPTRRMNDTIVDRFFVDCGRKYQGEPANIISGLEYLEGEKVSVLADGVVVEGKTVENGQITLDIPAKTVIVGLPYESVLETLTFDINTGDGSNLNRKKRVVGMSVKVLNSAGVKVSVNGNRETSLIPDKRTDYNSPVVLQSGFFKAIVASSHNESANIKIRQTHPLPITVVTVIPNIEVEK